MHKNKTANKNVAISARDSWMLRGTEYEPINNLKLTDIPDILITTDQLGMHTNIGNICYSRFSCCIYYTTPSEPQTIFAYFLLSPDNPNIARFQSNLIRGANPKNIEHVHCEGDVIALCTSSYHLYALTVQRGSKVSKDQWRLIRFNVNRDRAFEPGGDTVCNIKLPNIWIEKAPSFRIAALPQKYNKYDQSVFIFFSGGCELPVHLQQFQPKGQMNIVPLENIFKFQGPISKQPVALSNIFNESELVESSLLLTNLENGEFAIIPPENSSYVQFARLSRWREIIDGPTDFSFFSFNIKSIEDNPKLPSKHHEFFIVPSPSGKNIWTVEITDRLSMLPLIGGGDQGFNAGAPKNLLDLDIKAVDSVLCVSNIGIFLGIKNQPTWMALIFPRFCNHMRNIKEMINSQKVKKTKASSIPSQYIS